MSRDNERNYRRSGSDRRSGRDRRSEYCGQSDEEKFLGKSRFTRDSKRDIGVLMASVVTDRKIRKKKTDKSSYSERRIGAGTSVRI